MADKTKIEWTDATWNIITGCSVVSAGCTNCYAMRLAGTRLQHHPSRAGLTTMSKAGPVWTGEVRFNEGWLDQPLRWKRLRRIFVCAHGDLFHESVPDDWIDRVFAVMALAPQHTFQVLTKRPARMRDYVSADAADRVYDIVCDIACTDNPSGAVLIVDGMPFAPPALPGPRVRLGVWPLPNVWLGVSTENQAAADERIPLLLDTPAAVRWISAEPLLDGLDLTPWLEPVCRLCKGTLSVTPSGGMSGGVTCPRCIRNQGVDPARLDWVVAGGESGPGSRITHPSSFRSLRDQCAASLTPFHLKQLGDWLAVEEPASEIQEDEELRNVGDWADGQYFRRVGKKAAGRLLDGVEHSEWPL